MLSRVRNALAFDFLLTCAARQTETFSFPDILLHAVCRDTSAYPKPCLYCHVDRGGESVEIRFVPDERASGVDSDAAGGSNIEEENAENVVDRIFRVMSECASLHPDPIDDHSAGRCCMRSILVSRVANSADCVDSRWSCRTG